MNQIKVSVILIDGGFRENIYSAKYFSEQDFPGDEYEILWVDFYDKPNKNLSKYKKVNVVYLNNQDVYHSSFCFNKGIAISKGDLIIIADPDQIIKHDFISKIWEKHINKDKLVLYGYRYDEEYKRQLKSLSFNELDNKCVLKNPFNYGGCLSVKKKWLLKVNGYEEHPIFQSGFHANGLDMYTRFKNIGLCIQWDPSLKLYHPWHPFTLKYKKQYDSQFKFIKWRQDKLNYLAFFGINKSKNIPIPDDLQRIIDSELNKSRFTNILPKLFWK